MPSYLVGHGGALSPGTAGGNPFANALSTGIALDNQVLARKREEAYDKQLALTEKAQRLRGMESQLDLVGSKSPAGQQILGQYAKELGIDYNPDTVDPEAMSTVIDNGRKKWSQVNGDPKMSPAAKQEALAELVWSATDALARTGGTQSERQAYGDAIKGMGKGMQDQLNADQRQNNALALEGVRQGNRLELKGTPGAGGSGGGGTDSRVGIDASAALRGEYKVLEGALYPSDQGPTKEGMGERSWQELSPQERDWFRADARRRSYEATRASNQPAAPFQNGPAMSPLAAPPAGMQPGEDPTLLKQQQQFGSIWQSLRGQKLPSRQKMTAVIEQLRNKAGMNIVVDPQTGVIQPTGDYEKFTDLLGSLPAEDLQSLTGE